MHSGKISPPRWLLRVSAVSPKFACRAQFRPEAQCSFNFPPASRCARTNSASERNW